MKIAIVRGDFAAPAELPNFLSLSDHNQITLFTGLCPVWDLGKTNNIVVKKLLSPVDLNLGNISRLKMSVLNRIFVDAHKLFGLEKELKGFDIAHCAETYFNFTQQCINAKEKGFTKAVISTVWENMAFNNESIRGRKEFKSRAFAAVDRFLAVTKTARNVLTSEGCDPNKIEVLMPGIDLNLFKKTSERFVFRNDKDRKLKLLFSGRLVQEKGILELIDIFVKAKRIKNNIALVISGDGPLRNKIEEKIENEKIKDVLILGKVPFFDMPKLYSSCDVLVHYPIGSTTWREQYGMSLIEAMACRLPVIGLKIGSVEEIVDGGGVVSNASDYFFSLMKVINNPRKMTALSTKAERVANSKYDSRSYARRLQNVYSEVLKNK